MDTKYNYVLYNFFEECYEPIFWPLKKYPFVRIYKHAFESGKLKQLLFFVHWSAKVNRILTLPFKGVWFKRMCKQNFNNNKPCCYIFHSGKYIDQTPALYDYIKKLNPDNKAVVIYCDLISKKQWDISKVKSVSDMIVTYDKGEAEEYGVDYFPLDFYGAVEEVTTPDTFENDVYFLGFAKDRLEEIHSAYRVLSDAGCKCKFIICGTQEKDRIEGEGLHYISPISYRENLKNVNSSRCVLEIIQGGSCAPTLRLHEACTYKRKLITNNTNPEYNDYIDSSNLLVYENAEEIDTDFGRTPVNYKGFESEAKSPLKFIEYLENNL